MMVVEPRVPVGFDRLEAPQQVAKRHFDSMDPRRPPIALVVLRPQRLQRKFIKISEITKKNTILQFMGLP